MTDDHTTTPPAPTAWLSELGIALDRIVEVGEGWSHGDGPSDLFTCSEVDAFTDLLSLLGRSDLAAVILVDHSVNDDEGDEHYSLRVQHHGAPPPYINPQTGLPPTGGEDA